MEYNRSMDAFNFTFNLTQEFRNVTFMNEENYLDNMAFDITAMVFHLIAVITNLLVVVTISASIKQWKYSMGILMLTLAVCDTVLNLMGLINYTFYFSVDPKYFFATMIVFVFNLLIPVFRLLSILLMLAFSLNRYALVCKPFTHHRITSRKSTVIQIIILAVIAVIANIPLFLSYSSRMTLRIYKILKLCEIIIPAMLAFIPLIITLVLTILVIIELNRSHGALGASSVSTGARQGERNITRSMVVTIMAFVLLVFPSSIFILVYLNISENNTPLKTLFFTYGTFLLFYYINYSINIFIYTLFLPKFRSTLFGIFKCNCCIRIQDEPVRLQTRTAETVL